MHEAGGALHCLNKLKYSELQAVLSPSRFGESRREERVKIKNPTRQGRMG